MRPLGWFGVALFVAGGIVLAMRGVSYTKDKNEVDIGPLHMAAVEKGFVPPMAGLVLLLVGAGLVVASRRKAA